MPNFSSLARLEVPEKFVWVVGGVCKVIFMSNPTVVFRLGLGGGFDNYTLFWGLSVPGEVPRCSASMLALLASFFNSVA